MSQILNRALCIGLVCLLAACASKQEASISFNKDGEVVSENLSERRAVEVYDVQPKDMSYVNYAPDVDHEIVQKDGVTVYEVPPRNDYVSYTERKAVHAEGRWESLLSMWRGGLDIGSSMHEDDKNFNE